MTDDTDAVRRRTVLQRAAAGLGGALAVGAAATDEATAAICEEVTDAVQTYDVGCPPSQTDIFANEGDYGVVVGGCSAGSVDYTRIDWHNRFGESYVPSDHLEVRNCDTTP